MTLPITSVIQKVKDELSITEDLSSTELYDLLHKYRSSQHPDKFVDDDRKKEAEEKFKKLNNYLLDLSNIIEQEKLQKKPSEIIPFQKDYEIVITKQQNINYEKEIESLKFEKRMDATTIKELKKQILNLQGNKVEEKTEDLIKLYKPSKKSLFSQGITFVLTLTIGVLTKVDEVQAILIKYFPFDPRILNYIIFAILIYIPFHFLKTLYKESQIEYAAKRIKTPIFINGFLSYLTEKKIKDSFSETNVYEYLLLELKPRNLYSRLWNRYVIKVYNETSIDSLKDIFIYNLLNKQLITISSAEQLDRKFKICKTTHFTSDFDDLDF
jgi:hypothetical protein